MIVTIVAIAENGCHDPNYHMETLIFFSVTIVKIRIATILRIETSPISKIMAIKSRSSDDRDFNGNHFAAIVRLGQSVVAYNVFLSFGLLHLKNGVFRKVSNVVLPVVSTHIFWKKYEYDCLYKIKLLVFTL